MLTRLAVAVAVALACANLADAQTAPQSSRLLPPVEFPRSEREPVTAAEQAPQDLGVQEPVVQDKLAVVKGPMVPGPADPAPSFIQPTSPAAGPFQESWWVTGDYIMGWVRSAGVPPLVTTSPPGTAQLSAGVLGANSTVVFGQENLGGDMRSGFRLGAGGWLDTEHTFGMEAGFFMLGDDTVGINLASPTGTPILARPFFNLLTGKQASDLIAFPGLFHGSVSATANSNEFYSANVDFQEVFLSSNNYRFEGLLGYQFLRFNDALRVDTTSTAVGGGVIAAGTTTVTADRFTAENSFHGADFGVRAELFSDRWSLEMLAKLAVGNVNRSIGIAGTTMVTAPGTAPVTSNGGILALGSNSGVFHSDDWVIVPEAGVTLGYALTNNIVFRVGYSFLYWTDAARASNQVSTNLNPNLFPPAISGGPTSPTFTLQKSDIFVQTLNLGVEFRF
jgi:hypothetical protein